MPDSDNVEAQEDDAYPLTTDPVQEPNTAPNFAGLSHAETESTEPMTQSEEEVVESGGSPTLLPDAVLVRLKRE